MLSVVQTKAVADKIVQAVLSQTGFVILIVETAGKMVNRTVDEHHLCDMEKASTTVVGTEPFIERSSTRSTRPSKTLSV